MKKIAVFSSGKSRGSNFMSIYNYLKTNNLPIYIDYIIVTDKDSPIVNIANEKNIKQFFYDSSNEKINEFLIRVCLENPVDLIVLAGFMRKLSNSFFSKIKTPVINIHPALLPLYGGKNMFGMAVHEAVFLANERFSGATVHFVNEKYDEGKIIIQQECEITDCNSPLEISQKVLQVEHKIYPEAIKSLLISSE